MGEYRRELLPDPADYYTNIAGLKLVGPTNSKWKTTSCDFHGGSDSMRIFMDTGGFRCMNCGARGGDVVTYHMAVHGVDFATAAKSLSAWHDDGKPDKKHRPTPLPVKHAFNVLVVECNLIAIAGGNIAHGVTLTDKDRARVLIAARRIRHILETYT